MPCLLLTLASCLLSETSLTSCGVDHDVSALSDKYYPVEDQANKAFNHSVQQAHLLGELTDEEKRNFQARVADEVVPEAQSGGSSALLKMSAEVSGNAFIQVARKTVKSEEVLEERGDSSGRRRSRRRQQRRRKRGSRRHGSRGSSRRRSKSGSRRRSKSGSRRR